MKKMLWILAAAVLAVGGCSKSNEGTTYNYATGNLTATLNANVEKSYNAALKALQQLELKPTEQIKDAFGARIVSTTSADKKLTVTLKRINDELTSIVIEVGMVGDKLTSKAVYDKIIENLKQP